MTAEITKALLQSLQQKKLFSNNVAKGFFKKLLIRPKHGEEFELFPSLNRSNEH